MKTYKVTVESNGTTRWYNEDGQYHREDGPAVEWADGTKKWYLNGQLHREDGPVVEWANGDKFWYLNGQYLTEEEFNNTKQQGTDPITEWLKEIKNDFIPQVKVETDVYYDLIGGRTIKKWEYYLNERDGTWGTYQAALQGHIMNIIKKKLDQI